MVRIRRVDDEELVVPALDSRSEPLAADALLQRGPGVGELRRLGNLRPGARDRAAVRDVDAVEVAVDRSGQLVQQGRRLVDRIELRAVSRVGKGHVADVLRVDGAGWVDQRPVVARTAVGGLVEAVVRVAAAPAGCRDQVARVLRVDGDVVDDVLVGRVRVARVRSAGQIARVRRERPRPGRAEVAGARVPVDAAQGGNPDLAAREPDSVDRRALELCPTDAVGLRELAARRVSEPVDAAADVARAAGVGLAGREPECSARVELEIAR